MGLSFGYEDEQRMKELETARRQLAIAVDALERVTHLGDANSDCNHSGEYLYARQSSREALDAIKKEGDK